MFAAKVVVICLLQNVFEEIFNRNAKKLPVYVHERPKKRPFVQYFLSLAVVYAGWQEALATIRKNTFSGNGCLGRQPNGWHGQRVAFG